MQRLGQEEEEEEERVIFREAVVLQEESRGVHVKMIGSSTGADVRCACSLCGYLN